MEFSLKSLFFKPVRNPKPLNTAFCSLWQSKGTSSLPSHVPKMLNTAEERPSICEDSR